MNAKRTEKTRPTLITIAAVVLAALAFVLLAFAASTPPPQFQGRAVGPGNAELHTAIIPNTVIYLNRSQSGGTYVPEYVTLNNSSTLTKLPTTLTVVAASCRWVIVQNLTAASSPQSAFHNVQYRNVTSANASGTVQAKGITTAFKACGANAYFVNYVYWTYSIYRFASTGLGLNESISLTSFSKWPSTATGPANVTATLGPNSVAQFIVASNLTAFTLVIQPTVTGATTCDVTGQVCSYPQYTYVSSSDAANVTKLSKVVFNATDKLLASSATYENWTVGFNTTTLSVNTAIGGFFASSNSFFQMVFVTFWWAWVVGLLAAAVIVAVVTRRRR